MKRTALRTAVVLSVLVAAVVLWKLHIAILLLVSFGIAAAVDPIANSLMERRLPRVLAIVLVYLVGVGLLAALFYVIGTALVVELPHLADRFSTAYEGLIKRWATGDDASRKQLAAQLPALTTLYEKTAPLAFRAISLTAGAMALLLTLVISVVLSVYWTSGKLSLHGLAGVVLEDDHRDQVVRITRSISSTVGDHVRLALVEMSLCAMGVGLAFRVIGAEYWATAGAATGLALLIPVVGPFLAVVAAVLIGLATGKMIAATVGGVVLAIVVAVRALIVPRVLHHRRPGPILLVLTAMALGIALGPVGLVLAPPVSVVLAMGARRVLALHLAAVRAAPQPPTELEVRLQWYREAGADVDPELPAAVREEIDRRYCEAARVEVQLEQAATRPAPTIDEEHLGDKLSRGAAWTLRWLRGRLSVRP